MVEWLLGQNTKCTKLKVFLFVPFFLLLFTFNLLIPVYAFDFDMSVDDDIRKNYNPSKLENDMALPALPKILSEDKEQDTKVVPILKPVKKVSNVSSIQAAPVQPKLNSISSRTVQNSAVLKKGTKVKLKLITNVSDKSKIGSELSFVSVYPVITTYFTIPMGTTFKGEVVNSHRPQFTGNGGLIVLKINSVVLENELQPVNAYVTKVNSKHIFFNNIKGKRRYIKSMFASMSPGQHFLTKMIRVTENLASDGSSIVLTPFSIAAGAVAIGGNALVSPALALFHKGDSIYIKTGSQVDVKLLQDVFIYY